MPNIYAGARVKAADYPRSVTAVENTSQVNLTNTSYLQGSPVCAVTFIAPTSGQVLITVGMGARDNGGTNRVHLAPLVRLTNASGAQVLAPDVGARGVGSIGEASDYMYIGRTTLLEGLTPGQTYYAHTVQKVSGGNTADITTRDITVAPVPLGGGRAGSEITALDMPPAVEVQDFTAIDNATNTTYQPGTPVAGVTFTAPSSGRVLLIIGGGLGNGVGNRVLLSPQVFQGTSAAGTEILAPGVPTRGFSSYGNATGTHYGTRETLLEGLTPGQNYYARVMHKIINDGLGNNSDIKGRQLTIAPIS